MAIQSMGNENITVAEARDLKRFLLRLTLRRLQMECAKQVLRLVQVA